MTHGYLKGPLRATLMASTVILILASSPAFASTFNIVSGFNTAGVPQATGGLWTYGTETALNASFSALSFYEGNVACTSPCSPIGQQYSDYYYYSGGNIKGPTVAANTSASPATITISAPQNLVWPSGFLLLASGSNGSPGLPVTPALVVLRWTAPVAGIYDISGTFENLQFANDDVYVSINGVTTFANTSAFNGVEATGSEIAFGGGGLTGVTLASGATVDFIAATNGNIQYDDVLGLSGTVSSSAATPEPGTWSLLSLALGVFALGRRRLAWVYTDNDPKGPSEAKLVPGLNHKPRRQS